MFRAWAVIGAQVQAVMAYMIRKPAQSKEIDHKEIKTPGSGLTFTERADKAKYKGSFPTILTSIFNLELMNCPLKFNGDAKNSIDEKEFESWERRNKSSWLAIKKTDWLKITPLANQNEQVFEDWLKKQTYEIIGPIVNTKLESIEVNEERVELIEKFIRAIEAVAATGVDFKNLGTNRDPTHTENFNPYPSGLLNYLSEFEEINSTPNIQHLSSFKKISLIQKLIAYLSITNDILDMHKLLPALRQFTIVTRKICLDSHDSEKEAEAEIQEVAGQEIKATNLLTRLLALEPLNGYIKALIYLAECGTFTQEDNKIHQENLTEFTLRLKEELKLRDKLIQSLQNLLDYHHDHLDSDFDENKRNAFLKGLQNALVAHQKSARKKGIEIFLNGLVEIPRLHRQVHDSSQAIQQIETALNYLNNKKTELPDIQSRLQLEQVDGNRDQLITMYTEQLQQEMNRLLIFKTELIDLIDTFLKLTKVILATEKHSIQPGVHQELELQEKQNLCKELLFSLLPEEALVSREENKPLLNPTIIYRLQKLRCNYLHLIPAFSSSARFFKAKSLMVVPTVPLIEYHPELSPDRKNIL